MHIHTATWQNFDHSVDILSVDVIFKLREYLKTQGRKCQEYSEMQEHFIANMLIFIMGNLWKMRYKRVMFYRAVYLLQCYI